MTRRRRPTAPLAAVLFTVLALAQAAPALAAGAPAGPPGPPPGLGFGLPLPPPPGQAPPAQSSQPGVTIPATATGPGLLSGFAAVSAGKLPVRIACQANGRAQLRAGDMFVKSSYKCSRGRSTVSFTLTRAQAGQLAHSTSMIGALTLQQGATTAHLSLSLGQSAPSPVYWVSAFGLSCAGGSANLVAPNFSSAGATTIDVRPWLAWYTSATGWQWFGSGGPDRSTWYRWTATSQGVAEWQQPTGITPWTWGPITVTPGRSTYVIAVFEAIYWYSHPNDVWAYAHSEPAAGGTSTYCVYP